MAAVTICRDLPSRWRSRRMCAHLLLLRTPKWPTCCWTAIYKRMLAPTKTKQNKQTEKTHIQEQRRSPNKMVGGMNSCLESNPIPTRDTWRAQKKKSCSQQQRDWARPAFACWRAPCRATDQQWSAAGTRTRCSRPGSHSTWQESSWRRLPLAPL